MLRRRHIIRDTVLIALTAMAACAVSVQSQSNLSIYQNYISNVFYIDTLGGYIPEIMQPRLTVYSNFEHNITNVRAELLCSDAAHLVPATAGDSLVRRVDTIFGTNNGTRLAYFKFAVTYTSTLKRQDSVFIWFRITGDIPATGERIDTLTRRLRILVHPRYIPYLGTISLHAPEIRITKCSGYNVNPVPVTLKVLNSSEYSTLIEHFELDPPPGWYFAPGDTNFADMFETVQVNDSISHTWHLVPPYYPYSREHEFRAYIHYSPWYSQWVETTMDTGPFVPHLVLAPDAVPYRIRYDILKGQYADLPFKIDATLAAWGGDFEPVTVEAELIHGAWLFLELDESAPGTEIEKHVGPLAMCDSVELRWQAKLIKPNEYGTPYEGAIKYTVYNADSSLFKEFTQRIIIDAVNQTSAEQPPAALEMELTAFPNPVRGSTTISYTLPTSEVISLQVYDMMGRRVATLFEGTAQPGTHWAAFHTGGLPPGMYTVKLYMESRPPTVHLLVLL